MTTYKLDWLNILLEPPNPCEPNPCRNGGKCRQLGNSFSCQCKDNTFGGPRCEYMKGKLKTVNTKLVNTCGKVI